MPALRLLAVIGSAILLGAPCWARSRPEAVSPGAPGQPGRTEARCPTFSWGELPGAMRYELVVYRISGEGEDAPPVIEKSFTGAVDSWTPSLDECLERGTRYAWSLRAISLKGASEWSVPLLFEIALDPRWTTLEETSRIVARYLAQHGRGDCGSGGPDPRERPVSGSANTGAGDGSRRAGLQSAIADAASGGDPTLQVNDSPVVTAATLGSAVCGTISYRWVDLGNGTVLDCNTGKIWLKDADCLGYGNWSAAEAQVASLNSGLDLECYEYTAGAHADWRVPEVDEWCSAVEGDSLFFCPDSAAATSLIDRTVPGELHPKVSNTRGDGLWAPDDAFVDVQSAQYWSATSTGTSVAWFANLFFGYVNTESTSDVYWIWAVRDPP